MSTPLSSLAPGATTSVPSKSLPAGSVGNLHVEADIPVKAVESHHHYSGSQSHGWAWGLVIFIILVIIIWLILWAVKPTWVQQTDPAGNCTGEIDNGKAFLWAVVIAIIILVIIWLIKAAAGASSGC